MELTLDIDLVEAKAQLADVGYCVLEGLLDTSEAERLDEIARALVTRSGYGKFNNALEHVPDLAPLCMHPAIVEVAEHWLGQDFYLCNSACFMQCQPGAPSGTAHSDWPAHRIPQPFPSWPMLMQTMWMLTDFTEENGATRVVPGSHLLGRGPEPGEAEAQDVPVVGKKGSVLIWHNALWHRNGPNTSSDQHRMGANVAYIPWVVHRPPEEWPLISRAVYEKFPQRLQQMLERSVESQ
jgi:ectoine hydroxylase-related dioxygenase (phytanoyl-CoA dioxygenase family)